MLIERKDDILWNKSGGPIEAIDPCDQAERTRKYFSLGKTFQNRLFIDQSIKKLNVLERWNEIERLASDHQSSYVDCQTKLNDLIDAVRQSAKDSVR
jgi:hypothetical protein